MAKRPFVCLAPRLTQNKVQKHTLMLNKYTPLNKMSEDVSESTDVPPMDKYLIIALYTVRALYFV